MTDAQTVTVPGGTAVADDLGCCWLRVVREFSRHGDQGGELARRDDLFGDAGIGLGDLLRFRRPECLRVSSNDRKAVLRRQALGAYLDTQPDESEDS